MKLLMRLGTVLAFFTLGNLVLPMPQLLAVQQRGAARPVVDIALGPEGRLAGQLFDSAGKPLADRQVVVRQEGRQIATQTGADGKFVVTGVRGGTVEVVTDRAMVVCRGWAHLTAPPVARDSLLLVANTTVERGQRPITDLFFADPLLVGLIVAAAIAIPIAVHNSKDSGSSS